MTKNTATATDENKVPLAKEKEVRAARPGKLPPRANPYDVIIVGLDQHPDISADFKPNKDEGIGDKDAETRRKLYVELFDERAFLPLDAAKLAATAEWGVGQRITLYPFNGCWYVVDGRQRVKYARAVYDRQTKEGVPVDERVTVSWDKYEGDISDMFATSRVLNIKTDEPPMMRARSIQRLLMQDITDDATGKVRKRTVLEVAGIFGCSDQHIRDMVKLFNSPDTVKQALSEFKQPTIGLLMTGLDEEQQQKVIEELRSEANSGKKVTVAGARAKIQEAKGKEPPKAGSPTDRLAQIKRAFDTFVGKFDAEEPYDVNDASKLIDSIARAVYSGEVAFPTPIKDQKPGYTLAVLSELGD